MKQIFDWLRDGVSMLHKKNPYDTYWERDKYLMENAMIAERDETIQQVRNAINEAEAKWEADCCEWKRILINTYRTPTCVEGKYFEDNDMNFCPYCGKPIKISEVE